MPEFEREDLEKCLGNIFDAYDKNNLIPKSDKKSIISAAADFLEENNFDEDNIKNKKSFGNVKKLIACEFIHKALPAEDKEDKLSFDLSVLFKSFAPSQKDEMHKDLKNELSKLLNALNMKLEPGKQRSDDKLDDMSDKLSADLVEKHMQSPDEANLAQNKDAANLFAQLNMMLCSLYGGIDPRFAGMPVQEQSLDEIFGNLESFVNSAPPGGLSYMSKANTVDAGDYDYTESESFEIENAISSDAMGPDLERTLMQEGYMGEEAKEETTNANWPPKPHHP